MLAATVRDPFLVPAGGTLVPSARSAVVPGRFAVRSRDPEARPQPPPLSSPPAQPQPALLSLPAAGCAGTSATPAPSCPPAGHESVRRPGIAPSLRPAPSPIRNAAPAACVDTSDRL